MHSQLLIAGGSTARESFLALARAIGASVLNNSQAKRPIEVLSSERRAVSHSSYGKLPIVIALLSHTYIPTIPLLYAKTSSSQAS